MSATDIITRRAPAAVSSTLVNKGALRHLRVRHREFVRDVVLPADVNHHTEFLPVNPALHSSFPWLCSIANRFELYDFNKLAFEYIPTVGTSTDGAIAICPDYDPADDNSNISKAQLFSFQDSVRCSVWDTCKMVCSASNLRRRVNLFTRTGDLETTPGSTGLDLKLYDSLQLGLSITAPVDTSARMFGELWVSYDITFHIPQMEDYVPVKCEGTVAPSDGNPIADFDLSGVYQMVNPLADGNGPVEISSVENTIEFFFPGLYQVLLHQAGATNITVNPSFTLSNDGAGDDVALTYNSGDANDFTRIYHVAVNQTHIHEPLVGTFTGGTATAWGSGFLQIISLPTGWSPF